MKSILISIQPKRCELIANGKKTVEVRKTKPKLDTPFKCYIYCTKAKEFFTHGGIRESLDNLYRLPSGEIKYGYSGEMMCYGEDEYNENNFLNGKVIGEFICNEITVAERGSYCVLPKTKTMIDELDLLEYADGKTVYGWHISNLVIYDKPKELNRFQKPCIRDCDCGGCENAYYTRDYGFEGCALEEGLTRPPQSWCYVEELGDDK